MSAVKTAAREVIERLPEDADWEELRYQLDVRKKIEIGLQQIANGEVIDHDEVFRQLEEIDDNDHQLMQGFLDEQRQAGKERMRREIEQMP